MYLIYIVIKKYRKMKKTFKVLTETNKVKFVNAYSKTEVRLKMYQLLGKELFTIKPI